MDTLQSPDQQLGRYEGYLQSDPDNVLLRLQVGDLYHQAGRLADAVACYQECLQRAPGHPAARSRLAAVMITQHDFAGAETALRGLLAETEGGEDPALLHNLGLALYYQERWAEAGECFDKAAQAGLDEPSVHRYRALTLHHRGDMPEAIAAARRWAEQAQDPKSRGYLALLYLDNNETQAGRQLALQVLAEDPQNPDANVVNGMALAERQEVGQARRHFETSLHHEPLNGRAWLGLGLTYLYEQEHAKAIEAIGKAARIFPDNPGTLVALGWAQLIAMDPAAAQQTFEQAVRAERNFSESHGGLAAALAMQQKIEQAEAEILVAKRLDRRGFGAEYARAAILAIKGNQQDAAAALRRLLQQTPPGSAMSLLEQLRVHAGKGMAPKAAKPPGGAGH